MDTGDVVVVVFADLLYCRLEFALTAAGDENVGALLYEPLCCGEAYAAVSTCDYVLLYPSLLFTSSIPTRHCL